MIEEKTMCDRVGKDYVYILEKMCGILRHYQTNFYIDDKTIEKIEELCLGIETGKMEIIEFGRVLSKRNNIDKTIKQLEEDLEYEQYCNKQLRDKITNLEYKIKKIEEE